MIGTRFFKFPTQALYVVYYGYMYYLSWYRFVNNDRISDPWPFLWLIRNLVLRRPGQMNILILAIDEIQIFGSIYFWIFHSKIRKKLTALICRFIFFLNGQVRIKKIVKTSWTFWFLPSMGFRCLHQSTSGFSTLQVSRKNIESLSFIFFDKIVKYFFCLLLSFVQLYLRLSVQTG